MIEYLIMDVDGTLTDGKIYMGSHGEVMKAFSIKDGYAINYILKPAEITPIVLTARESMIVQNRCEELGITEVYQGKIDKMSTLEQVIGLNELEKCAYFGDDIIDLRCMRPIKEAGGIVACPADAVKEVKALADYICLSKAGEGALREFSEWLVSADSVNEHLIHNRVNNAVEYLKKINIEDCEIGKKVIVNDGLSYTIQSYDTKPVEECKLESHRKFIDIQIIISGREVMELADVVRLTVNEDYDEEKDVIYWNAPKRMSRTTLMKGDCIVLYPETAHRGAQNVDGVEHVLKVVGKVLI